MSTSEDQHAIQRRLGEQLRSAEMTLAVAESCTGGLVGSRVTDISGASDYFEGGVVTYSYDSKRALLGVSRESLDEHGAVSAPVAREMAAGIRDIADTTWGVSTTGVAGPTGGTEETPVGTAYVGLAYAGPWGTGTSYASAERHHFEGDRLVVKERITTTALTTLLEAIQTGTEG